MDCWMQTYSGQAFDYAPSGQRTISIIDIARSLSRLPRFLGHTQNGMISVAEHCVVMAQFLQDEGDSTRLQLLGLLHDAHEAYTGDLPKPFFEFLRSRYAVDLNAYQADVQRDILRALDIEPATAAELQRLHEADLLLLAAERHLAMPSSLEWQTDNLAIPDYLLGAYGYWDDDTAMRFFERAFNELYSGARAEERIAV